MALIPFAYFIRIEGSPEIGEGRIMQFTPEQQTRIRRIISTLDCPQRRPCHACDFRTLGQVVPTGDTDILTCLEDRGRCCPQGLPFGGATFCQCPLRKYLADHKLG